MVLEILAHQVPIFSKSLDLVPRVKTSGQLYLLLLICVYSEIINTVLNQLSYYFPSGNYWAPLLPPFILCCIDGLL